MKITAGLGSPDDYILYAEAGADELFCGYVPEQWMLKYGLLTPLNRREVFYYNVQIGSESELEILGRMVREYRVPVSIALNGLFYRPRQYPVIGEMVRRCAELGFRSFIVADPALLLFLHLQGPEGISLHVSGEMAQVNHYMVEEMRALGAKRIIFHRKNTLEEMKLCIGREREIHPADPLEYEAFVLNEMCHFTGAFCSCLHCDELAAACRLPYRFGYCRKEEKQSEREQNDAEEKWEEDRENSCLTGRTGCGLCALWRMREAGVTHLKLVSRGNYAQDTAEDIRQLRRALEILEKSESEIPFIQDMKRALFKEGCSRVCYYPGQTASEE